MTARECKCMFCHGVYVFRTESEAQSHMSVCPGLAAQLGKDQHVFDVVPSGTSTADGHIDGHIDGHHDQLHDQQHDQLHDQDDNEIGRKEVKISSSCSSKVLILGGYTILQKPNKGVSLATTARFTCNLTAKPWKEGEENDKDGISVTVESRQFHTSYVYSYSTSTRNLTLLSFTDVENGTLTNPNPNPFSQSDDFTSNYSNKYILSSLSTSFSYFKPTGVEYTGRKITIELIGDKEFYTGEGEENNAHEASQPQTYVAPIIPSPSTPTRSTLLVHKTGLGSSATLCTSLTS
eukprot:CAMPEP_0118644588 /NCGR_PEP_ID=MMETSP0785-20121206/7027_1 /TAXON_ID=91992 /ORGANISM="Bolidomonas pacifica, Strain CCMP 1866" /LENGTH=291 /DNA_ID=CAMNT_0006536373 /DNA_START=64 /DNA_END=936 /DNA_ORIENTATION=+